MKRGACALGMVLMGLWLGGPVAAQESESADPPAEAADVMPAPPAPAEEAAPAPTPAAAAPAAAVEGTRGITVFGELLFLKPTLDDTYFAISSPAPTPFTDPPSGHRVNGDFDFEPAFRIGAGYEFAESGREVELSYTRLDAEASETVSGSFLWATRGSPNFTFTFGANTGGYSGSASAEIDAQYQRIDAHVTLPLEVSDIDLGLSLGFEWADFRVGEDYVYVDTGAGRVGKVTAASRSWGIGPEVGLGLDYEICEPWDIPGVFSLRAGSSVGLLLSETHTRASQLGAATFSARDDETSRVITALHARVGVGYAMPLADRIEATFGVGYQIDTHLRGLSRIEFVDDVGRSLATTDYQDFDLQGVYLSFGVVF
ncbi:MAG: Lpg1974 family pore-forming outer membrane protein [Myxococcota bacterium]